MDGWYDIKISNFINIKANERTIQSTNNDILRQKNRLIKTDEKTLAQSGNSFKNGIEISQPARTKQEES